MESPNGPAIVHSKAIQGVSQVEGIPSRKVEKQCYSEDSQEKPQVSREENMTANLRAAEGHGSNHGAVSDVSMDSPCVPMQHLVDPPQGNTNDPASTESAGVIDSTMLEERRVDGVPARSGGSDYFLPEPPLPTDLNYSSRATSASTLASSAFGSVDIQNDTTSAPHSPQSQPGIFGRPSIPSANSVTSTGKPPRPTSVPILTSNAASSRKRRDGPDYPRYPDQSFAALQAQHYPPPYQPHSLRTRSSHTSQNSSFSSIPSRSSRDQIASVTGAKTVGGTPAHSPGLFSPVYPASRSQMDESEDSQTSTPLMHPTHTTTPKETHVLSKEFDPDSGRKILNNYELLKVLGRGQHGTVKLGRNLDTGESVAVKIVRRHPRQRRLRRTDDPGEMIKREIAILKKARHPHVVSLLEVIDDEQYEKVYLILEFVELGEIVWRKITDKDVATFELNRIRREHDGHVDSGFESAEIERFNSTAVVRRSKKAQAFEQRAASTEKDVDAHGFSRPTSAAFDRPFWSLEHGGDSEDDAAQPSTFSSGLGLHVATDRNYEETSLATSIRDPLTSNPLETPRPRQAVDSTILAPSPQPATSPASPASLAGTMYGPYTADEHSTETRLQTFLNHSLTEEQNVESEWTAEEREFMWVPCLTISQALDAFRDTVLGLEFLHYQGIIHRDIKPANLLWTASRRVKISDFGVSYLGKPIRAEANTGDISSPDAADADEAIELAKTVGTPAFYAPELCNPDIFSPDNKAQRPPITGQIDVWALGITLYGMLFGRLPFWDSNEFGMYEKIANEPLFIPRRRLKGVEDTPKPQMNSNKRFDDIIEYEEIDDELCDLLKRLLDKDPLKRITIKEVKHHPWVLRGIQNQPAWIDETDPNLQSEGRKIEISNEDVQEAVIPLTIVERIRSGFGAGVRRMGSAIRGRNRKRAESDIKDVEGNGPTRPPNSSAEGPDMRRSSLRGDEHMFTTALRASRDTPEHPLSQSVTASPELKAGEDYFDDAGALTMANDRSSPRSKRPSLPDRSVSSVSNAESMRTIRPAVPPLIKENSSSPSSSLSTTPAMTEAPAPSSLSGIWGGGRRLVNKMRSRERERTRDGASAGSSRSSSISAEALQPGFEDPHGSPSLAFSTAVAAGHVDQPPALRDDNSTTTSSSTTFRPTFRPDSSSEAFQRALDFNNRRHVLEHAQTARANPTRHRATSSAANVPCPPSPDDLAFPPLRRPASAVPADEGPAFGISSSSDQIASTNISESFSHPSIPSVVSGASSVSGTIEPPELELPEYPLEKTTSPSTIVPRKEDILADLLEDDPAELTPRGDDVKIASEEDAGYHGEEELDSDSDDGVLEMGRSKTSKTPSITTTTTK